MERRDNLKVDPEVKQRFSILHVELKSANGEKFSTQSKTIEELIRKYQTPNVELNKIVYERFCQIQSELELGASETMYYLIQLFDSKYEKLSIAEDKQYKENTIHIHNQITF